MPELPPALWIIGPPGAGKTYFASRHLPDGFHIIDQDAELERELVARAIPLDTRLHDRAQMDAFRTLRTEVANRLWRDIPALRARGVPLAFETTGDKPHLLRDEVHAGIDAGYRNAGIALRSGLETCLRRNRERPRVLPDSVIEKAWRDFEDNIAANVYQEIFGTDAFMIVNEDDRFDVASLTRIISARKSPRPI